MRSMRRRDVIRSLEAHGCRLVREGGRHTVYACEDGQHQTAVPRHTTVTAGVVQSIQKAMECLPKGWLQ